MPSYTASFVLRLSLRRSFSSYSLVSRNRYFYSLSSSPLASRILIPCTLAKSPSLISPRLASSKVLSADDKIKRADENLLRVLESEIECAEEEEDADQEAVLPKDASFEIVDNPGDQVIVLKRELAGEKIEATVYMNYDGGEAEAADDEDDTEDDDNALQSSISLVVTIDKGSGPILEFCCSLSSDEVEIESMALKSSKDSEDEEAYQGPAFSDLDEGLQKALRRYLATRGIKASLHEFLRGCMMSKDDREYKAWLKNLKEFVER